GRERVGLPPHGGRAQANRQRAALDRLRRGRAHPRRRRSPARGDTRRGLPRRAARARRRRCQGGQYLRAGLLAEPGVLLVLPHHADDRRPDPLRRAELDARRAAPPALGKKLMRWLLPEYIEDILPAEAARIEQLRRKILDLFFKHDYELVMPPLLEYTDSL